MDLCGYGIPLYHNVYTNILLHRSSHPPNLYLFPLRKLLADGAVAEAGTDEGTAEGALGGGHVNALEPFEGDRAIDEDGIEVNVRA